VADALDVRRELVPDLPDDCTRDELRSVALGWLAHPEDVVALLAGEVEARGHGAKTRHAIVHVHLHRAVLGDADGVARVEEAGPLLVDELAQLLGHARVTLAPVIDLSTRFSVNGYEHPESVKDHTHLRCVGDVFPHAVTINRKVDLDHPDPFDAHGPPGQTGDHGHYLWRSPHGLERLVDATGTHELDPAQALELAHPGALSAAMQRIEANQR
jgi:hypothetical protein